MRVPAVDKDVVTDDVVGEFVVPLPVGQPSGTYVLVARLDPDALGANAVRGTALLSVKVGNATLAFDDAGPLRTAAGTDRPVAGSLRLEDGTGLPGRLVDLALTRGATGNDPEADAGFVPVPPDTALVTDLQVTTDVDGVFSAVLSDPVEDGQGTELGGSVAASTAPTPDIGDADTAATLAVDLVSENAPAGSTLVLDDLGDAKPGQSLASTLTLTAPDDTFDVNSQIAGVQGDGNAAPDPVEGQLYTISLDHGFFTTGDEELPSVIGEAAGNLEDLGTTLTGLTAADGTVSFEVAIERDTDFDDDGRVSATVTAVTGDLTATTAADWDTAEPLNGRVEIALSPADEQIAPVDPAVIGDLTYFEVFTRDQFGNPVDDEPVDLTYAGDLDDFDYSDDFMVSDLDRAGDIWVVSFEDAEIDITGTWDAPTFEYTDTAGNAVAGNADATGTTTASFYELSFPGSTFAMTSSATDVVRVGSTVTQTVTVVDQLGNPVRGYRVQFFRFGPDTSDGEPRASRVTNARGEATYTFVGPELGRARVTAEVTDGVRTRTLGDVVVFGSRITARLTARSTVKADRVSVAASPRAAGARVTLFRIEAGKRIAMRTQSLAADGTASFAVPDRNGPRLTTYVADVRSTPATVATTTNSRKVR